MTVETPDYRRSPVPVRDDLVAAHRRAWARLAAPGEWWTGAVRLAIGIPLEEAKAELSADLRGDLGLDDWSDAEDRIRARVL